MSAARATTALVAAGLLAVGCTSGDEDSVAEFCQQVPNVRTATTAPALAAQFRSIAEVAPADIEADWRLVTDLVVRVADLDPSDDAGLDAAYDAALDPDVQRAAESIRAYTQVTCGVSLDDPNSPILPAVPSTAASDPAAVTTAAGPA